MEGKSTRAVRIAVAAVASLVLHAALIGGAARLRPDAGRPGGPRGDAVLLRVVDAAPRAASGMNPLAASKPNREAVPPAGDARRRVARAARPAAPRRTAAGKRVAAAPGTPALEPAGGTAVAGGEPPGATEAGGPAAPGRPEAAVPAAPETGDPGGGSPGEDAILARRRAYALVVRQAIEAGRTYPVGARRREAEGEVVIRVRIGASGRVDEVRVEASSGHPDLDRAAMRFARSVPRLPPPPGGSMWVRIPIEFSLR